MGRQKQRVGKSKKVHENITKISQKYHRNDQNRAFLSSFITLRTKQQKTNPGKSSLSGSGKKKQKSGLMTIGEEKKRNFTVKTINIL